MDLTFRFKTVPSLETERLTLREHRLGDLNACAAMWADPLVTRYIGGVPFSKPQTWNRLLGYVGHWKILNYGYWAVEEKSSRQFIGEMGFANFKRDFYPPINEIPELGWALTPAAFGKGYATEGLRAVSNWGDQSLESEKTVCLISPENLPSLRVAEKCGYQDSQGLVYANHPVRLFSRSRP